MEGAFKMANEVKDLIKDFVLGSDKEEITVSEIFEQFPDFDPERNRVDVLRSLRALEIEEKGVLAVGRRGRSTRFIKNATRIRTNIPKEMMETMSVIIKNMKDDELLLFQKNGDLTIDNNIVYHADNRAQVIECLKDFAENEHGRFIIGRRGGLTRFQKKVLEVKPEAKEEAIIEETEIIEELIEPKQDIVKYNIINNILFKTTDGQFSSIEEALKGNGNFDATKIKQELDKFGYVKLD